MDWNAKRDAAALKRREPEATEMWFLAHADQIYTFVFYRVGRDPEVAADVVQETFLAALDRIDRYDSDRGSMSVWLMYLARNSIRSANRHRSRMRTDSGMWERIDERLVPSSLDLVAEPLPLDLLERREAAELVQMTLVHLEEKHRRALVEHYFEHRSLAEMAGRNAMTEGAVKSLLFRARNAFRVAFGVISGEVPADAQASGRTS